MSSNGPMPRAVLTEILGVLVKDPWARSAEILSEETGVNLRTLRSAIDDRLPSFERGGEEMESFYREIALQADLDVGVERFSSVVLDRAVELVPENLEFLQELRANRGIRLVAVSNIPGPVFEAIEGRYHLSDLFDDSILSFQQGMAKPNAQVYIDAIDRAKVAPGEIVFVAVSEQDVAGAGEWGLRSVRLGAPNELVSKLSALFGPGD